MSERPWIVQKFGGTSVGKFPVKIAKEIVAEYEKQNRCVVVCSARSNNIKAQGTTTCLLRAAEYSVDRKDFHTVVAGIQDDHLNAARAAIQDAMIREMLEEQIVRECAKVSKVLEASHILDEVSPRTMDLVLSAGERLACLFMVSVLRSVGQKAELVDLSRVVSGGCCNTDLTKLNQGFYDDLRSKIAEKVLEVSKTAIPVVTGFFGLVPGGLINAVGRGYTDLCAALCAVGLEAKELQIWKEVDGIFTADPRKVPEARLLPQISPDEAAELTYYGSEVIHPFTMDQVIRAQIPIRIKNVMNPAGEGTKVFPVDGSRESQVQLAARRGPTAITSKSNIIVLNVISNRTRQSHGFLAQVFGILDKWRLVVDLISTSEVHVSMAIHEAAPDAALVEALKEIRKFSSVEVTDNLSIVSLVGTQMRHNIGIAASMFTTLSKNGVNIEMISQGSSEINISCVIHAAEVSKALRALHNELLKD